MSDALRENAQLSIALREVGGRLSQASQADRLAIARELLTTITDPALAFDLSAVAQEIDETVVRLVRTAFEEECQ